MNATAQNNLRSVALGIVDPCQAEYAEKNLENWQSVSDYASNACNIELTKAECEKVLRACLAYLVDTSGNDMEHFI